MTAAVVFSMLLLVCVAYAAPGTASVDIAADAGVRQSSTMEALIPGGRHWIGTNESHFAEDAEGPAFLSQPIQSFYIDKFEASVEDVAAWIAATGHVTDAETFGWSFVHRAAIATPDGDYQYAVGTPWWLRIDGATWQHPRGPDDAVFDVHGVLLPEQARLPAVHLSWMDAVAYCAWKGKRLPTEVEWEVAARGGKHNRLFPWGNLEQPAGKYRMNICDGNSCPANPGEQDGYPFLAPVDAFGPQNDHGMHNIVGNVWEWVADDWCSAGRRKPAMCARQKSNSLPGDALKVKKGGSFMCNKAGCYRYRCAARSQNTADTSSFNIGVRCARNANE